MHILYITVVVIMESLPTSTYMNGKYRKLALGARWIEEIRPEDPYIRDREERLEDGYIYTLL